MQAREGDLLKAKENWIFDVKGLVHPPNKVIAFPRYIPDSCGNRKHEGTTYKKVYNLNARFKFLEQHFPHYLIHNQIFDEILCEVPVMAVEKHYKPIEKLQELRSAETLDALERKAVCLVEVLESSANVPRDAIGISGSLLVGLHTPKSDLDPIVYGVENCYKVHSVLKNMLQAEDSDFSSYNQRDLHVLFDFRSKDTSGSFEDFVLVESRKVLQGKFMGADYFFRFVKGWNEIGEKHGDVCYKNCGYAKVKAKIVDDSESIFTPCKYRVENVKVIEGPELKPILEIASFRGRFCEQARTGETVIAQGKIEQVIDNRQGREYFRILLGNKPSDYMKLA